MADYTDEQVILKMTVDYEDAIYGVLRYKEKIEELKQAQKDLADEVKAGKISEDEYQKTIVATNVTIKQYQDEVRGLSREIQNNLKAEKANNEEREGSMVSLRAQLSNLTKAYDALGKAQREGAEGKALAKSINEITTELKGAEEATQRYHRNVGNYENAIKNALGGNSKFVQSITVINDVTKNGVSQAFKQGQAAVAGFGKQLLTLLANPIVAIIAGIATAIMAVTKVIKSNEEQTDRVRVLLAPINAGLTAILNLCQKFVGTLLSVAEGAGKLAMKLGLVNETMREGIELQKEELRLKKLGRENTVQDAKDNADIAALRKRAARERITDEKAYLATMKEIDEKEKARAQRHVDQAKAEWELAKADARRAKNSEEQNEKLAQAEANYYNAKAEYDQQTTRDAGRVAAAEKKVAAAVTDKGKAAEDAAAKMKEMAKAELDAVRSAQDALIKLIVDNVERQRAEINISYTRRIEDLRAQLAEEGKLTEAARQAINDEILAQEKLRDQELANVDEESNTAALERAERRIALLLEAAENDALKQRELRLQQLDIQQQLDEEQTTREVQNETERQEILAALRASYQAQRTEIETEFENDLIKKREEAIKQSFTDRINEAWDNEMEQERLRVQERLTLLEEAERMEGESQEAFNSRKLQLQADYNEAQRNLQEKEFEVRKANAEAIAGLMGSLGDVFGELGQKNKAFAVLQKTLALGEIAVNTGVALAAGIKQAQSVPFPANIAAVATTVATILANIATAIKTVNSAKFAEGGLVVGEGTGTSDSIPARLSNGESVLTAQSTAMFSPLLSTLNQLGGGVPIVAPAAPSQQLGEEFLAAAVARGMAAAPRPVVSVEEITSVKNRVEVIENIASV